MPKVMYSFSIQGWYIVTYALGIYLLNLFIAFLTPKIDPALPDSSDGKFEHSPNKTHSAAHQRTETFNNITLTCFVQIEVRFVLLD